MSKIKSTLPILLLLAFAACRNNTFTIGGTIAGAGDTTCIYLERLSLPVKEVVDSAKVGRNGRFSLRAPRPDYPDIYQLRIGGSSFLFPVDSTENILIEAAADNLREPSAVSGSDKALEMAALRTGLRQLQEAYERAARGEIGQDSLLALIEQHKQRSRELILADSRSIVAYYALFQQVGDYYLFSPYAKEDRPYMAAVATTFHTFMPGYYRSQNLYTLVLNAISQERKGQNEQRMAELIEGSEATFPEIALYDGSGHKRRLSDLVGKVVLIDFTAFEAQESAAYILDLRELYNKYASRGFQIYQVSVDRNVLLWQQATAELPWPSVLDRTGEAVRTYQVNQLPTRFLMDRSGLVVKRDVQMDELDSLISDLL